MHISLSNSEASAVPRIELPAGGKLIAFPELQMQSAECSAITNLQTQIAPLIASMSCQLHIFKLLKPLIAVIHGLPNPPAAALREFSKAANELAPCLLASTPAALLPFVRDLICLEIRSLNCFLRNLQSLMTLADADPRPAAALEAQNVLDSYQPIAGILNLASALFQMAGVHIPPAPTLAAATDPGSLRADQIAVTDFTAALQSAADALGGCT